MILEAHARGVPVIATDVGACRELIEGREAADREIGPSGFVTRVAAPKETAAALVKLARDPRLRRRLGAAGWRRVAAYYQRRGMLAAYRALYASMGAGAQASYSREGEVAGIGWKLQRLIDRGSLAGNDRRLLDRGRCHQRALAADDGGAHQLAHASPVAAAPTSPSLSAS